MLQLLESKTVIGLGLILLVACIMSSIGKLSPELVEVIKYVGTAYMGVRMVANAGESYVAGKGEPNDKNGEAD